VTRPRLLVAAAGTATEIGKTWVAARLLAELRRRDVSVAVRKPVQSFTPGEGPTDADVLGAATGEDPEVVCPAHRWLPVPMAPPMAADALGQPSFSAADLLAETTFPAVDVGLVETVGGVRSPMTADTDSAGFVRLVRPDLTVLVADAALGTINAVRLSAGVLDPPVVVMLNRYDDGDDLHRRNRAWLTDQDGLTVVTAVAELAAVVQTRFGPDPGCSCNQDPDQDGGGS
jgi:dethiobiotin synthetase